MRDKRMYDAELPGDRRGGRKGRWQPGAREGAGDEFSMPLGSRRRHGQRGGGRGRARRGDARYILLDALAGGPKHGYELIKTLEERSAGKYIPSPGTVYPTLQYLEDQGLVRASQDAERRIYQLTAAGQAELEAQASQVAAFWERIDGKGPAAATQVEVSFLQEELEHLNRIAWSGLRPAIAQGKLDAIRHVRSAVQECQNKVRELIATELPE